MNTNTLTALYRLSVLGALTLTSFGCASLFTSTSSGPTEAPEYTGPIELTNESQYSVCTVEFYIRDGHFVRDMSADPLATGETVTLEPGQQVYGVRLVECGNTHVLWDTYEVQNPYTAVTVEPTGPAIVLADNGAESLTTPIRLIVERNGVADYLKPAGSMHGQWASQALQVAQGEAQADDWLETVTAVTVTSQDWDTLRNEYTSIITGRQFYADVAQRWPDGHCSFQVMAFYQEYDGSGYSSNLVHNGFGIQEQVPCATLAVMESRMGGGAGPATPAAAPTGGNCSNTCSTANDGECDDGGPNSLYSVCPLGTDCNDCGPR